MTDWNPSTMYNSIHIDPDVQNQQRTHVSGSGNQEDRMLEQRSGSLDHSTNQSEAQREFTGAGVFPSDFGGYLRHPETMQNSNLQHESEDMSLYSQKKQPSPKEKPVPAHVETRAPPPDYTPNPPNSHEEGIMFFGDSNTTEPRARSRSTLDQDGLRRGSITTLPSASSKRKSLSHQRNAAISANEVNDPTQLQTESTQDNTNQPTRRASLGERAYAAAAGVAVGVAGVATSIFNKPKTDDGVDTSGSGFVVRDEYGPYKDATTCNYEPAIHGQEPCFKSSEERNPEVSPDSNHAFCKDIQEPSLHGERPSYFAAGGTPQSQLDEPTKPTDLGDSNMHEGQVSTSPDDIDWEHGNAPILSDKAGIPQSQLHEPNQSTDLGDANVSKGQISSCPKNQDQGVWNKSTLAATGMAAATGGAATTLFGSKHDNPQSESNKPTNNTDSNAHECQVSGNPGSSHMLFTNFKGIPESEMPTSLPDQGEMVNESTPQSDLQDTKGTDLNNSDVNEGQIPISNQGQGQDDESQIPTSDHTQGQGGNLSKVGAGGAAVAAGGAAMLLGSSNKHEPTNNQEIKPDTHPYSRNGKEIDHLEFAPVATTTADNLNGGSQLGSSNNKPTSGILPSASDALTANLNDDNQLNLSKSGNGSENLASGIAPTAAVAATSVAAAQPAMNKEKGGISKAESIPSDKSISSARAIQHGEFAKTTDSTDPSLVRNHHDRKNSLRDIKTKAATAFRRLSRDSSINKSSIVKQDDGHRLSNAEKFKKNVTPPQQAYVSVPGVTPSSTEESGNQFVRTDVSSGHPTTETPSLGSYVNGQIEHRRGSLQKIMGKIMNNQTMKEKGEMAKISGKEKIEAYKASKDVHPNDAVPIRPTNLDNF